MLGLKWRQGLLMGILVFFCLSQVWAEEPVALEGMTVTANKVEEDVQEVPAGTTVFSGKTVEDLQIESISDVADYSPNFMVYEMGTSMSAAPSMRGLLADIHSHSVTVGMYVDGVPILDGTGYVQEMIDIERIEVLRGPQGTLYGKSAEAGIVNIISRRPGNTFSGNITGEAGINNKRRVAVNLSGPIKKDTLYLGVSALRDQKDGWVERITSGSTVDDVARSYGTATLRYTPMEALDIVLKGTYLKFDDEQPHMNLTPMSAAMYGLSAPENRKTDPTFKGHNKSDIASGSLRINWDLTESLKLTSTTTYRKLEFNMAADYDFYRPTYLHWYNNGNQSAFSQEIRASQSLGAVKWVAGIYGDKDKLFSNNRIDSVIPGQARDTQDNLNGKSISGFGHASVPIGYNFSILGGLRYDYQEKDFESTQFAISLENHWDEFSPKIGVEYQINPTSMTYFTASKGYLSGGFNPYADQVEYLTYDEEKLWSYEIGNKNTFFSNRLILDCAVYYMNIHNVQVQERLTAARTYTTNAAKATGKGFEISLSAIPLRGLTLKTGFGYSDLEFDEFKDAAGDYKGNKKPYAPEYSFNVVAQYRSMAGFYCEAAVIGYGAMYTDKANEYERDPYQLVNAKIGYETERFDAYLYGKNIFDATYDSVYGEGFYVNYSEPAEAGVALTYRF